MNIYILCIWSFLEQSCQVWHYTITEEEFTDLEQAQKVACHIILKNDYRGYDQALQVLELDTL